MLGRRATKRVDLLLYVNINDFSEYAYKKLVNLPAIAKHNSGNEFLSQAFDANILVSKLVKVGNKKKLQYSFKIQSNYKLMIVLLKYMLKQAYITIEIFEKLMKDMEEICKLNNGYLEYLLKS